jgi:hypothetical protein
MIRCYKNLAEGGIQLTPKPIRDLRRFSRDFLTSTSHFLIEKQRLGRTELSVYD